MSKSLEELKNNYINRYTISLAVKGEGANLLRTELTCDVCGETCLAWNIHQIPYYADAKLAADYPEGYTMMACEKCIAEKQLTPLETDAAIRFDASNLAIKEIIEARSSKTTDDNSKE